MKPFFCRIGSKDKIHQDILNLIPDHIIYVEAFVGSGAIFWRKPLSEKTILNDLDKDVIDNLKLLKKTSNNPNNYNIQNSLEDMNTFVNTPKHSIEDKLLQKLYLSCGTFGSIGKGKIYKEFSGINKINNINDYIEKLKNVVLLNQDYKSVIHKYDSDKTFFFLDPPYEKSTSLYKNYEFDYNELRNILDNIKGYFMLTLNDSKNIRKIFKDYLIKPIVVKAFGNKIGEKNRKELIIMNYKF